MGHPRVGFDKGRSIESARRTHQMKNVPTSMHEGGGAVTFVPVLGALALRGRDHEACGAIRVARDVSAVRVALGAGLLVGGR